MALKTKVYIIPTDELTLTDEKEFRKSALEMAENMARDRIAMQGDYIARPPQLIADFGCAVDSWRTAALAVVGTAYTVFQAIAAPAIGLRQVVVWYKVSCESAPPPVSFITFQEGAAGRTTFGVFNLEELYCKQQTEGYLSEPVVYPPGSVMLIQVICRVATGVFANVALSGFVIEPSGPQISG